MDKFLIDGPSKIKGKISISGSKNASLPILAATLLFDLPVTIKNLPRVKDISTMLNLLKSLGSKIELSKDKKTAKKFLSGIKSSIAIHNASTQFADGGEFGFGAEVGISTNKLHPRGPIGLDQLTTYKYILEGRGQIRS